MADIKVRSSANGGVWLAPSIIYIRKNGVWVETTPRLKKDGVWEDVTSAGSAIYIGHEMKLFDSWNFPVMTDFLFDQNYFYISEKSNGIAGNHRVRKYQEDGKLLYTQFMSGGGRGSIAVHGAVMYNAYESYNTTYGGYANTVETYNATTSSLTKSSTYNNKNVASMTNVLNAVATPLHSFYHGSSGVSLTVKNSDLTANTIHSFSGTSLSIRGMRVKKAIGMVDGSDSYFGLVDESNRLIIFKNGTNGSVNSRFVSHTDWFTGGNKYFYGITGSQVVQYDRTLTTATQKTFATFEGTYRFGSADFFGNVFIVSEIIDYYYPNNNRYVIHKFSPSGLSFMRFLYKTEIETIYKMHVANDRMYIFHKKTGEDGVYLRTYRGLGI